MKKIFLFLMLFATFINVKALNLNFNGVNPNNYLIFNNEVWRIISFNKDGTIKIIKNNSIGKYSFDNNGGVKWHRSSLNKYLNSTYYKSIKDTKYLKYHSFNLNNRKYYAYVGLIDLESLINSNSNSKCLNINYFVKNIKSCNRTSFIGKNMINSWTMSSINNKIFYIDKEFSDTKTNIKRDVYPVCYLKSKINLIGKGTVNNPYKISD